MYLKRLEIQGFKSFADKTVLTFDDDITAIVGPNGSGKSNISDAIRWVMGEQSSKSLRGAKMEDVIFGGTQKRAQLGFAEVSLILDNSDGAFRVDGAEVMVTRRYYRSGESEYYINKQSARLRDINELFMDTGLGREGYSNIGQGKIDEILSLKSTDRREIFEEAAGISKYRHRKEDTERRLAATEENLLRIGDKISELELQLEPLRRQAEQAKKYLAYREELQGLEVAVWLDSLERLTESVSQISNDYEAASQQLAEAHGELTALYQQSEQLSLTLHARDLELDALRVKIAEAEAEVQRANGEKAILQNNLQNSRENIARVQMELDDQRNRTGGLAAQIAEKQARVQELLQNMGATEERLQQALSKDRALADSAESLTAQLLEKRTQQAALLREAAQKRAEYGSLEQLRVELGARQERLKEESEASESRVAELERQADELKTQLRAAQEEATAEQNRIAGFQLRLQARREKYNTLEQQRVAQAVELSTDESKIRMYQEMERDYDGYSRAVRELMQEAARGRLRNIHGPVSRLIHVSPEYTTAIETALGGAMQHVVVSAEEDGRNAISFLKRRDLGRATFLPLTTIRGRVLQERDLTACSGFVGLASELVQTEDRYRAVVTDLLGRTAVVDTLDHAIAMARRYQNRFRIVTLDGQLMNAGGSMTGGSVTKSAGILARDNALQQLLARHQQRSEQLAQLTKQVQEADRLAKETEFELTGAQERLRAAQDCVLRLEGDCKQADALLSAVRDARENAGVEQAGLAVRLSETETSLQALAEALSGIETKIQNVEQDAEKLGQEQLAVNDQSDVLTQQITQIKMQAAALEAERASCDESVAQLRALEQSMQGDRVQREALLAQYERDVASAERLIEAAEQQRLAAQKRAEQERENLQQVTQLRRDVEADKTAADRAAQEKNKQILLLERETARLEQKKATSELEQSQIIDRLWDNYGLTHSTAQQARAEIESVSAANRKIAALKQKITALGTPNLGAIDEFDRINERFTYLNDQRSDVLQSRRDLEGIIGSITTEMTEIFLQQFARINEYFGTTFTEMFGGGKASLELEDRDSPLDCGIEIRVQPPGKQLKTITLLSGGEKAFVAIALYFAILRVRPTPFCMLDEIDAALDERNVSRFAAYLRNLCKNTQFIVITHRRGTMEACDVLYGVTMQEQGVSRIIGIDLNELQMELGIE